MTQHPLAGRRIVITRPPHKAESFAAQLRALGAEPVLLPTITIQPPSDPAPLDRALTDLARYDWLIITSANTVTHLWQRLAALGLNAAELDWPAVAIIGPATGRALGQHGIQAALMPAQHVVEALFEALSKQADLSSANILLPQGDLARPVLADLLREAGAQVDAVVAYENVRPAVDVKELSEPVDAITFTSSSTVENFVTLFDDPLAVMGHAVVACIGPVTAEAARGLGLSVHVMAEQHTVDGLIAALSQAFERNPTR
ncbi:MAG: uroporphyrinogen-III synthase [Chloroflexi bacterium]|nr:uroporphyrinogen-III synthase [Chloroflexota bacterium]